MLCSFIQIKIIHAWECYNRFFFRHTLISNATLYSLPLSSTTELLMRMLSCTCLLPWNQVTVRADFDFTWHSIKMSLPFSFGMIFGFCVNVGPSSPEKENCTYIHFAISFIKKKFQKYILNF